MTTKELQKQLSQITRELESELQEGPVGQRRGGGGGADGEGREPRLKVADRAGAV